MRFGHWIASITCVTMLLSECSMLCFVDGAESEISGNSMVPIHQLIHHQSALLTLSVFTLMVNLYFL